MILETRNGSKSILRRTKKERPSKLIDCVLEKMTVREIVKLRLVFLRRAKRVRKLMKLLRRLNMNILICPNCPN